MSSTFHAVVRGPSFTGLGNRPVLTPAHHVERPIGIGPCGARIDVSRTKPEAGRSSLICSNDLFNPECCIVALLAGGRRAGDNVFLENAAAHGRVESLLAERGINPAKESRAGKRATLFCAVTVLAGRELQSIVRARFGCTSPDATNPSPCPQFSTGKKNSSSPLGKLLTDKDASGFRGHSISLSTGYPQISQRWLDALGFVLWTNSSNLYVYNQLQSLVSSRAFD